MPQLRWLVACLSLLGPGFNSRPVHVGIVIDKIFSEYFLCPLSGSFHQLIYSHSSVTDSREAQWLTASLNISLKIYAQKDRTHIILNFYKTLVIPILLYGSYSNNMINEKYGSSAGYTKWHKCACNSAVKISKTHIFKMKPQNVRHNEETATYTGRRSIQCLPIPTKISKW